MLHVISTACMSHLRSCSPLQCATWFMRHVAHSLSRAHRVAQLRCQSLTRAPPAAYLQQWQ
eukprot:5412710-Amphidinium_carterae.1